MVSRRKPICALAADAECFSDVAHQDFVHWGRSFTKQFKCAHSQVVEDAAVCETLCGKLARCKPSSSAVIRTGGKRPGNADDAVTARETGVRRAGSRVGLVAANLHQQAIA